MNYSHMVGVYVLVVLKSSNNLIKCSQYILRMKQEKGVGVVVWIKILR